MLRTFAPRKKSAFGFGLAVFMMGLAARPAAAAEILVGGYTLDGWTVTGGWPPPAPSPRSLVLPAGSSISRVFSASELTVRFTTQPTFSADTTDWGVLTVGSASLAFICDGEEGRLALLIGQQAPEILPYRFKLDGAGRAVAPVELEFGQRGGTVSLSYGGKTTQFPVTAVTSLAIVISSGAGQPWAFDDFSVGTPDPVVAGAASTVSQAATDTARLRQALATLAKKPAAPPDTAKPVAPPPPSRPETALEVFTPPSGISRPATKSAPDTQR
jgi:hypothetical protein